MKLQTGNQQKKFSEKINEIGKSLARLIKTKRQKIQITNTRGGKAAITTDPMDIKWINKGIL